MSFNTQKITIQQETRASDGAGGKVSTWSTLGVYTAEFHLYKRLSEDRIEKSLHHSEGPGVQTRTIGFFKLLPPFPVGVIPSQQIVDAAGKVWQVNDVRNYDWTMQIDVELVF